MRKDKRAKCRTCWNVVRMPRQAHQASLCPNCKALRALLTELHEDRATHREDDKRIRANRRLCVPL